VGSRLAISILSAEGVELLADVIPTDPIGELEVAVDRSCALNVTLHGPEGDEVQRQFAWDPARLPILEVDLCGSRARRIRLDTQGEPRNGTDEMLLFGLHDRAGESPARALLTLHDGRSAGSLALPPGEYFYRLLGASAGCVVGIVEIGTWEGSTECTIAWKGHGRDLSDFPRGGSGSLVVESIDGRELSASVPEELRTFPSSTPEDTREGPLLYPETFTYRVYGK
jgi:hypothetical protein